MWCVGCSKVAIIHAPLRIPEILLATQCTMQTDSEADFPDISLGHNDCASSRRAERNFHKCQLAIQSMKSKLTAELTLDVKPSRVEKNSQKPARYTNYYGVATISRLLKIIGLFCKRAL